VQLSCRYVDVICVAPLLSSPYLASIFHSATAATSAHSKNNAAIVSHMEAEGIDFLQFAFRWVNCLLIREVPFGAALRLWDTYLAEGPRFNEFLVSGWWLRHGTLAGTAAFVFCEPGFLARETGVFERHMDCVGHLLSAFWVSDYYQPQFSGEWLMLSLLTTATCNCASRNM